MKSFLDIRKLFMVNFPCSPLKPLLGSSSIFKRLLARSIYYNWWYWMSSREWSGTKPNCSTGRWRMDHSGVGSAIIITWKSPKGVVARISVICYLSSLPYQIGRTQIEQYRYLGLLTVSFKLPTLSGKEVSLRDALSTSPTLPFHIYTRSLFYSSASSDLLDFSPLRTYFTDMDFSGS